MAERWKQEWRGKWALITGASAGIGMELAKLLAEGGANLILTARRVDRLEQLATELTGKYGIKVEVFATDLTRRDAPAQIYAFTTGKRLEIELLINNAGFGAFGNTHEIPLERMLEMVQLNCAAVVHLTRLYLPAMVERRHGDVMIVASLAGFQPLPYSSEYGATKAFDLIFAEGVAEEMRHFGVRVSALCPGTTTTEFQTVAQQPDRIFRKAETADKVARVGLEALANGKPYVISGFMNKLMKESQRIAPRSLVTKISAKMMRGDKA
ncbi:MAG: SDR family oxidoreductase [Candidatus Acidiferrales bacterium]